MSRDILIALIDADPAQPRQTFDDTALAELAASMQANGLIQPIMVRPVRERYVLVHGERRLRAARLLGWETIAAESRELSAEEAPWVALVENLQRVDLNPMEEARAYHALLLQFGVTQTLLAKRIGKSQSHIATTLRFLSLAPLAQIALATGSLTEGHAKQLLRVRDLDRQAALCARATHEQWSVLRLKQEVDAVLRPSEAWPETPAQLVIWWWEQDGRVPRHTPYPEEEDPETWRPPIAIQALPRATIVFPDRDYRLERRPHYAHWLSEIFVTLPPIAVYQDAGHYILADGRYRLMAAELLQQETINARIYVPQGTLRGDARPYAVQEEAWTYGVYQNSYHGANYTPTQLQYILHELNTKGATGRVRRREAADDPC